MRFFSKLKNRNEHTITLIAEFIKDSKSLIAISFLSDYVYYISEGCSVLTDLQSHPAGYRITYTLKFKQGIISDKRKYYSRKLSCVSDWLENSEYNFCLYRYHYNVV